MYYVIVRLFGLWYIAAFENGVMQYSIYGGYKREQDEKRQATIQKKNPLTDRQRVYINPGTMYLQYPARPNDNHTNRRGKRTIVPNYKRFEA